MDDAKTFLGNQGYDPVYGARPLKRFLQKELETRTGRKLIAGEIADGSVVHVRSRTARASSRPASAK